MSDVLSSLAGSAALGLATIGMAVPIGVGAAVWLEEYATPGKLADVVERSISALAGVPSVVKGLFGLVAFSRFVHLGGGRLFAASATLALVILPMVITSSRSALRAVGEPLREASFALGADRLAALRHVVLPMAMPGILRGVLVAFARAIGETAPLVALGALAFTDLDILPLSIFRDLARPGADPSAAAPAIAWLFALVFALHAAAFLLRLTYERRADRGSGRGSLE